MLLFCPACSNVLTITRDPTAIPPNADPSSAEAQAAAALPPHRFECRTCPYQMHLDKPYFFKKKFQRKKVEDVIGGEDSWNNVDRTDVKCQDDDCNGRQAFFYQVQIRSADEPMTNFYKCCICAKQWREG